MRILLDECVPRRFGRELVGHDVRTVPEMGWSGKKNGDLLKLMVANGFQVFLTVDQNVRYQQQLASAGIGAAILVAVSNRLSDLLPLTPALLRSLNTIMPGDIVEIRP